MANKNIFGILFDDFNNMQSITLIKKIKIHFEIILIATSRIEIQHYYKITTNTIFLFIVVLFLFEFITIQTRCSVRFYVYYSPFFLGTDIMNGYLNCITHINIKYILRKE